MPAGLIALMMPISLAGFGAPQGLIVWLLQPRGVPTGRCARAVDIDRAERDRGQPAWRGAAICDGERRVGF